MNRGPSKHNARSEYADTGEARRRRDQPQLLVDLVGRPGQQLMFALFTAWYNSCGWRGDWGESAKALGG